MCRQGRVHRPREKYRAAGSRRPICPILGDQVGHTGRIPQRREPGSAGLVAERQTAGDLCSDWFLARPLSKRTGGPETEFGYPTRMLMEEAGIRLQDRLEFPAGARETVPGHCRLLIRIRKQRRRRAGHGQAGVFARSKRCRHRSVSSIVRVLCLGGGADQAFEHSRLPLARRRGASSIAAGVGLGGWSVGDRAEGRPSGGSGRARSTPPRNSRISGPRTPNRESPSMFRADSGKAGPPVSPFFRLVGP